MRLHKSHWKQTVIPAFRSTDIGLLLEIFIVCAVITLLASRLLTTVTGTVELRIGHLHVTHVILSGLLMLIAMIAMQSFMTRAARRVGTVVGAIGFGLFMDNVGRFLTGGTDYFFQPAFAIIYALFIGLYLTVRLLLLKKPLTPHESLVNAVDYAKEAVAYGLDDRQRHQAQNLIGRADTNSPLYQAVQDLMQKVDAHPTRAPYLWDRLLRAGSDFYATWSKTKIFKWIVLGCFMAIGLYVIYEIVEVVRTLLGHGDRQIHHWVIFIAYFFAMKAFLVGDIRLLRGKRLSAYKWFNEGLLIWLLVVQVFIFIQAPLKGLLVLIILLLLLGAIRYMIAEEKSLRATVKEHSEKA